MANKRPRLKILRRYGIVLERSEEIDGGYDGEAERLCAWLIDCMPSGTVEEFTKLTGASMEKIFDAGNKAFQEKGQ